METSLGVCNNHTKYELTWIPTAPETNLQFHFFFNTPATVTWDGLLLECKTQRLLSCNFSKPRLHSKKKFLWWPGWLGGQTLVILWAYSHDFFMKVKGQINKKYKKIFCVPVFSQWYWYMFLFFYFMISTRPVCMYVCTHLGVCPYVWVCAYVYIIYTCLMCM